MNKSFKLAMAFTSFQMHKQYLISQQRLNELL